MKSVNDEEFNCGQRITEFFFANSFSFSKKKFFSECFIVTALSTTLSLLAIRFARPK